MIPCELVTSERPLVSHTVGKEDKYLLNKLIPPVDAEVSCLQFRVVVFDQEYCSGVEFYQSTNDGKMQSLLGRSCAFCVLRSYSEDDAILTEQIVERFEIGEVDIDSLKSLYDVFEVDIVQSCPRGVRHGLTMNPITSFSVKTFPILHALLRGIHFCLQGKCQSEGVDDKKADQCMVKAEQKMVQEIIKTKTVFLLKNETQ